MMQRNSRIGETRLISKGDVIVFFSFWICLLGNVKLTIDYSEARCWPTVFGLL